MNGQVSIPELGEPKVFLSDESGRYSPEQWADMMMNKLMSVSDSTPEPLRSQARELRSAMKVIASEYFTRAILSERDAMLKQFLSQEGS
jgi:hypothetical protein